MTSRNERRLNKKSLGKGVASHPTLKRMIRNFRRAGREAFEVYRVDGQTADEHVYFDVFSIREWAEEYLTPVAIDLDRGRAETLIASGAVDKNHIAGHTVQQNPRPIIVGRDANGAGNDQILDGSHTYVAVALAATAAGQPDEAVSIDAYVVDPKDWRKFLIPGRVARALNFDAHFDDSSASWTKPPHEWDAHFDA